MEFTESVRRKRHFSNRVHPVRNSDLDAGR